MAKSILIVEDDSDLLNALDEILTGAGFSVVHAGRAAEALYKIGNQRFDCILMDLRLGPGSGLNVIQGIRNETTKESPNYDTPIILMSGMLEPHVVKTVATKVQAIMAKPFDAKVLVGKVRELSEGPRSPR